MISIIVPLYNTGKSLKQCIESIVKQSYQSFELILVNDGSTDNSLSVCKLYANKDHRIKIIDKKNEGVDRARFSGLAAAKGDYVTFVDSDDWLQPNMLEVMLRIMDNNQVDYVEVAMQRVMDRMKLIKNKSISPVLGLIEQPRLFEEFYISFMGVNLLSVNMCGKMYRRDVLDKMNLQPSGLKMGEDLYFNLKLFPHLKSIFITDYIGYNYRFGGITTKYNPALFPDLKFLYKQKKMLINKFSYDKANDCIRYEIINVLKSDVQQKILYNYCGRNEIIEQLRCELNDMMWEDVKEITNEHYLNSDLPKAIVQKDAEFIYDYCEKIVRAQRGKFYLKKFTSMVLSNI